MLVKITATCCDFFLHVALCENSNIDLHHLGHLQTCYNLDSALIKAIHLLIYLL